MNPSRNIDKKSILNTSLNLGFSSTGNERTNSLVQALFLPFNSIWDETAISLPKAFPFWAGIVPENKQHY